MIIATILASVSVGYFVMFNLGRRYERRRLRIWLTLNWTSIYKSSTKYSSLVNMGDMTVEEWFRKMYVVVVDLFMKDYPNMSNRYRKNCIKDIRWELKHGQRQGD